MKTTVRFLDDKTVEITDIPSWWARLFGESTRRGVAYRRDDAEYVIAIKWRRKTTTAWFWKTTNRWVGSDIDGLIERSPVESIPGAQISRP